MTPPSVHAFRGTTLLGFLGVVFGALGAHGLNKWFAPNSEAQHFWERAVLYHLIHVVVLLVVACLRPFPAIAWLLFFLGIVLFSGSLYVRALDPANWLVHLTPYGGTCLMLGWIVLSVKSARFSQP